MVGGWGPDTFSNHSKGDTPKEEIEKRRRRIDAMEKEIPHQL